MKEVLLIALELMLKGMTGIFIVIFIIMLCTNIVNYIGSKLGKDKE